MKKKVLIVGDFMWYWYQEVCAKALENNGCEVERFGWLNYFFKWPEKSKEPHYISLFHRIQFRYLQGPLIWKINKNLLITVKNFNPDIIWFYNVQLIFPETVKKIRKIAPEAKLIQFANDNPFSEDAKKKYWRHFLNSIPLFDIHFTYRESNMIDFYKRGAKNVFMLRSYFIATEDYNIPEINVPDKFKCDVVFAGHYENDGRVELLEEICDAGYNLNLFGGGWDKALPLLRKNSPLRKCFPISPVTGNEYRYAICGAKVALCFLSKLNKDTYTRRNFQIPAMNVAMLSQFSYDLITLFEPNVEALFFIDKISLLEKIKLLINDNSFRKSIANSGYKRVYEDLHEVNDRMKTFLSYCSI